MAKKTPKVGENTVSDPTDAVVTAPAPDAVSVADAAVVVAQAALAEAEAAQAAAVVAAQPVIGPFDEKHPTIVTEDLGEIEAPAGTFERDYRVLLADGTNYEHSRDLTLADGSVRWVYRKA